VLGCSEQAAPSSRGEARVPGCTADAPYAHNCQAGAGLPELVPQWIEPRGSLCSGRRCRVTSLVLAAQFAFADQAGVNSDLARQGCQGMEFYHSPPHLKKQCLFLSGMVLW